jgi:hypothetical protein
MRRADHEVLRPLRTPVLKRSLQQGGLTPAPQHGPRQSPLPDFTPPRAPHMRLGVKSESNSWKQ